MVMHDVNHYETVVSKILTFRKITLKIASFHEITRISQHARELHVQKLFGGFFSTLGAHKQKLRPIAREPFLKSPSEISDIS